ncbi:MAG: S8 family peptidase [bacterium]|nr:S8 family peptidase [bacterium]
MIGLYKNRFFLPVAIALLGVAILLTLVVGSASGESPSRKIVVFESGVDRDAALAGHQVTKVKGLPIINAAVVIVPSAAAERRLKNQVGVLRVDNDVVVHALGKPAGKPGGGDSTPLPQQLTWGVDRVDAELVWPTGNSADLIKVAVVDTGISKDHPDLTVWGGVNTINSKKSWDDDNGHGSHVAGIIAANNNDVGVVGVAHSADIYAVKVLDRNGSGWLSDIIEGIQWSIDNGMQVINMSLGSASDVQSFHDAVIGAHNAGVVVIAAAGNNSGAVIYPAAYPETIAVSATDQNNNLASWSSRGPEVDLAAPGVGIYSTYKGSSYATLSGTSMASPHVAGSAALVLNSAIGSYDANSNGVWDPSEVKQKLQDSATDLGVLGFDNLFGWGLVNAYSATQ